MEKTFRIWTREYGVNNSGGSFHLFLTTDYLYTGWGHYRGNSRGWGKVFALIDTF